MLPDSIPSPKAAEPLEAQLRQWTLPDAPASLDARMQALFAHAATEAQLCQWMLPAAPAALDTRMQALLPHAAPAARPPALAWRKWVPAACALAACALIAVLLRPQTQVSDKLAPRPEVAVNTPVETPVAPAMAIATPQVFEGAVPVGYQYQSSRALYAEETPLGTVKTAAGQPQQAYQRRTLLRHTFTNPQTHATYEVDAPQEELILENLQSY